MNDKFDELAKGLAQSVTRRGALKKFGVGLAVIVLAALGLANQARAGGKKIITKKGISCTNINEGCAALFPPVGSPDYLWCLGRCAWTCANQKKNGYCTLF